MKMTPVAFALLAGCATTVADVRERPTFIDTTSAKSAAALSQCFAEQWSDRTGVVNSTQRERGFTMTLTYSVYDNPITAAVIDVDDIGTSRHVVVRARKGDDGDKLRGEIERCV